MVRSDLPTEAEWLEFENDLGISSSDDVDSSSSGIPPPPEIEFDTIYVISSYSDSKSQDCGFCVYSIDASSSSNPQILPLVPILRWDLESYHTFVILGSNLYMFGSIHDEYVFTSMAIFDMTSALSSPLSSRPLNLEDIVFPLEIGPPLNQSKLNPLAVVIAPSKICVFSTIILLHKEYTDTSFELFDTLEYTWTAFSNPPFDSELLSEVIIRSHCVHRSCLIIQTFLGIYGINFDDPKPHWVFLDKSYYIGLFKCVKNWIMVGNNLCSPYHVMRKGYNHVLEPIGFKDLLLAEWSRESLVIRTTCKDVMSCKGVMCSDFGGINHCIVRLGTLVGNMNTKTLLVDIVNFDKEALDKMGSDLSKWNEIQSDKSFTFELTYFPLERLDIVACFLTKVGLKSAYGVHIEELPVTPYSEDRDTELELHNKDQAISKSEDGKRLMTGMKLTPMVLFGGALLVLCRLYPWRKGSGR